ncbi:MAG: MATE family efflux transporter [Sphaerochaetaceae bacterium]|nr:MATE family efflux transporter [Sphaerochaetaceae bacterium]
MSTQMERLTQGSVNAQILRLSFPTMIGMLLQAVYDLVDMFWIGFISPSAIAAATLFSTFFWMVEVLNEIVGTSSVSLISQSHGAGDTKRTERAIHQTLLFKFLLAMCGAVLLGLALPYLFTFFSEDQEVKRLGLEYGMIRVIFLPIFFSSYSVNTIFRCTGDAKTPMKLMVISALVNLVADPLLMFDTIPGTSIRGMGWGMRGAAIATVGSITLSFAIGFAILLSGKGSARIRLGLLVRLDRQVARILFSIGLPSGINLLLRNLSITLFLRMVAIHGTQAIAVAGIGFRVYSFGMMPGWGLSMGSGIIIGHNLGADRVDRAMRAVRLTTLDCLLFVGLLSIPVFFAPSAILSLFMGGTDAGAQGVLLMRIIGPALLIGAAMSGMGAAFTGSGKNRPMLIASIVGQWAVMVPYALVVSLVFRLPLIWLWIAILLGDGGELIARYVLFRRSRWERNRV